MFSSVKLKYFFFVFRWLGFYYYYFYIANNYFVLSIKMDGIKPKRIRITTRKWTFREEILILEYLQDFIKNTNEKQVSCGVPFHFYFDKSN